MGITSIDDGLSISLTYNHNESKIIFQLCKDAHRLQEDLIVPCGRI